MSDITALLAALSPGELKAIQKHAGVQIKKQVEAERAVYGVHATELVEAMVSGLDFRESTSSDWAGFSLSSVPVSIDGTEYTLSVTLTDVARKATRKAESVLAEAQAKVEAAKEATETA